MKPKFYILLSILIVACSSDSSKSNYSCIDKFLNQENIDNTYYISLFLKIEEDDILEVYFIDDSKETAFQANKKIRKKVLASTKLQEIRFNLPNEILPYKLRIDLGENVKQTKITINEVKIGNNENLISIKDSLIPYFFEINNYLKLNNKNGEFDILKKENKRDPFITSNATLIKKIKIEL